MERPGPVAGVERYPEQPSDALARGQRPRRGVPNAVEQQQRNTFDFQSRSSPVYALYVSTQGASPG